MKVSCCLMTLSSCNRVNTISRVNVKYSLIIKQTIIERLNATKVE